MENQAAAVHRSCRRDCRRGPALPLELSWSAIPASHTSTAHTSATWGQVSPVQAWPGRQQSEEAVWVQATARVLAAWRLKQGAGHEG